MPIYNHYFKKVSKQDVTRSFVINKSALDDFFCLGLYTNGDEDSIIMRYPSGVAMTTRVVMKQDPRILLIDKPFEIGQIIHFKKSTAFEFTFNVLSNADHQRVSQFFKNKNYFLSIPNPLNRDGH